VGLNRWGSIPGTRPESARRVKPLKLAGVVGLVALFATGCTTDEGIHFGWPKPITPQGDRMREFWMWAGIASLVVGVIVWGLVIWTVAFHRKRKGHDELPKQFQYSNAVEAVLVVVPTLIVAVLFYFTITTQDYITTKVAHPDVKVGVTAFQWNWQFSYNGYTTQDGQPVKTIGSSQEIPLLVLPTGKTIEYDLRSTDVIHSFFVPAFNFKRDVFPDPEKNNQDSSFQNSIDRTGSFVGRCAELCGTYHSMMNFEVRAMPADLFDHYIQLRTQLNPKTALPYTAAEALTKTGIDEPTCGDLCTPYAVTTHPFNTDRTARVASDGSGS
jgi:cytochrome c oxidase subunit 2